MARHVSAREARNRFADIMGSVRDGGEEVIFERSGRPMAALSETKILYPVAPWCPSSRGV